MSAGAIVAIIAAVVVVLLVVAALSAARRRKLQRRFGPEYERVANEKQSQRKAAAELAERERRVRSLDIHPLEETARAKYAGEWAAIQEQFVDQPQQAVTQAGMLVTSVMKDRGYPTEDYDQILADLSVEHANTLDHYRQAHQISLRAEEGTTSTEELRLAMLHYRALFGDLLGEPAGRPATEPAPQTGTTAGTAGTADTADTADGGTGTEPVVPWRGGPAG
jgi:FtsZ-interacting cell division protein ZipA